MGTVKEGPFKKREALKIENYKLKIENWKSSRLFNLQFLISNLQFSILLQLARNAISVPSTASTVTRKTRGRTRDAGWGLPSTQTFGSRHQAAGTSASSVSARQVTRSLRPSNRTR
jgi:hypothetical protein